MTTISHWWQKNQHVNSSSCCWDKHEIGVVGSCRRNVHPLPTHISTWEWIVITQNRSNRRFHNSLHFIASICPPQTRRFFSIYGHSGFTSLCMGTAEIPTNTCSSHFFFGKTSSHAIGFSRNHLLKKKKVNNFAPSGLSFSKKQPDKIDAWLHLLFFSTDHWSLNLE